MFATGGDADAPPRLTGVFDFYFAGTDTWLFDLAVCLNDWAIDLPTGRHDAERADALLSAYESVRALNASERALLPAMLRAAALRFWISRLWDFHLPREASMDQPALASTLSAIRQATAAPCHPLCSTLASTTWPVRCRVAMKLATASACMSEGFGRGASAAGSLNNIHRL